MLRTEVHGHTSRAPPAENRTQRVAGYSWQGYSLRLTTPYLLQRCNERFGWIRLGRRCHCSQAKDCLRDVTGSLCCCFRGCRRQSHFRQQMQSIMTSASRLERPDSEVIRKRYSRSPPRISGQLAGRQLDSDQSIADPLLAGDGWHPNFKHRFRGHSPRRLRKVT